MSTTKNFWFGRPEPLQDESFASWFRRVAEANGISPRELYREALPGAQLYSYDLDRHACANLLASLNEKTGVSIERLHEMTFARWEGSIIEAAGPANKLKWLPPAGREGSRKSFGQQICQHCISETQRPFLRTIWRLAFATICEEHRTLLIDRCPVCGQPIQPLRSTAISGAFTDCWHCGFDFRKSGAEAAVDGIRVEAQLAIMHVVRTGNVRLGQFALPISVPYFQILDFIFRLLISGRYSAALRDAASASLPELRHDVVNVPRLKEVERLNTRGRSSLVTLAWHLMGDWPERLLATFEKAGLNRRHIVKGNRELPFALAEALADRTAQPLEAANMDELKAAVVVLRRRGIKPTRNAIRHFIGKKFDAKPALAEPERDCIPYGTHRYWKLDGVAPDVRQASKHAAKRAGENVGAWVNNTLRRILTESHDLN